MSSLEKSVGEWWRRSNNLFAWVDETGGCAWELWRIMSAMSNQCRAKHKKSTIFIFSLIFLFKEKKKEKLFQRNLRLSHEITTISLVLVWLDGHNTMEPFIQISHFKNSLNRQFLSLSHLNRVRLIKLDNANGICSQCAQPYVTYSTESHKQFSGKIHFVTLSHNWIETRKTFEKVQ